MAMNEGDRVDYAASDWSDVCNLDPTPLTDLVQETRAHIWPNLALEYICCFMIDSLSPDSSLFKSAECQTVNFGHPMLLAFEK